MPEKVKGEIVLVFDGAEAAAPRSADGNGSEKALSEMLAEGISPRRAAELLSLATGISQNRLYKTALKLKG
ncbi:MAG: hypothetical protein IMZ73_07320 [Chloroflexi bacterium]|nr:hypothetical protein [Chloroflexota bacterium]